MFEDSRSVDDVQDELDILGVQSGDVRAFRGLVDRWQVPLLRYASRLTGDRESAQDVVQEHASSLRHENRPPRSLSHSPTSARQGLFP